MTRLKDWTGLLAGRRTDGYELSVIATFEKQHEPKGASRPFPVKASNELVYWVKAFNCPQGSRVPITEFLVGKLGVLIGAPVCNVEILNLPPELSGEEYCPHHQIEPGLVYGSENVRGTQEKGLRYREKDDNSKRHAGYIALWDWCWGDDDQCIMVPEDDYEMVSHDHGYFLPPGGKMWTIADLNNSVDMPHEKQEDFTGLDQEEMARIANKLDSIAKQDLMNLLSQVPSSWPVSDAELEYLGFFLLKRAPSVATRIRQHLKSVL